MRTQPVRLHAVDETEGPATPVSEIIQTAPFRLVVTKCSYAADRGRRDVTLGDWFDIACDRGHLEPSAVVARKEEDDLPPFDYNDEGDDVDPVFVTLNRALWAPLDESEREVLASSSAPPAQAETAAWPGRDIPETCSDEQDKAEDNEKTLELALSFSVPRTKSQNFKEVMREARVVQGLIKLPASEEHAQPARLVLAANRKLSENGWPGEAPPDGRRRLLDAIAAGCLGGLIVAANALHSQFVVVVAVAFAAHCVRLAVPTPLIRGRRHWRMLRRLAPRRRRGAM